jgi:Txe/YoeB family toxin of Txe-Axe toxin-antitoxin module
MSTSPYRVVLTKQVKDKLENISKKDKNKILKAIEEIRQNPFTGDKIDPIEIETWPNEKYCRFCGTINKIIYDKNSKEVSIFCEKGCNNSWMTKKELIDGRKEIKKDFKHDKRFKNLKTFKTKAL